MKEPMRTAVFLVLGVVALVIAWFARPAQPEREAFDDSGERFFAPFDPLDARSMEIVSYDEDTAATNAFRVAQKDGMWSIPSHEDYPADAQAQLGKAAASVVDLVKGPKVSDDPTTHALYGVIDPAGDKAATSGGAGVGTRVTMTDAAGNVLVDFIIGKPVEGGEGLRYARTPGHDRVYTVKVDTTALSTKFEDWIERDLLKLNVADVRKVIINDYTVDEVKRRLVQGDVVELTCDGTTTKWSLEGLSEDEELQTKTVNELRRALDDLKIVDVYRKPSGLSAELKAADALELDTRAVLSLSQRGFYIAEGRLVSNQGETLVQTKDGVTYVLRFGEIALADRGGSNLDEEPAEKEEGASRYLFIMTQFDEDLIPKPQYAEVPELPEEGAGAAAEGGEAAASAAGAQAGETAGGEAAEDAAAKTDADREALAKERDRIIKENDLLRVEYEEKLEKGRETAEELNTRFADWYYVIPDSEYRKIRLTRADMVKKKEAETKG